MTAPVPLFFVPEIAEGDQERIYATMADACRVAVPTVDQRIYSIVFEHNREEWTATVGQRLRGTATSAKKRPIMVQDDATVLAIFAGNPFMVVTNAGPFFGAIRSKWVNPFLAGIPKSVERFRRA